MTAKSAAAIVLSINKQLHTMRHAVRIVSMNVKTILLLSILWAYLPILAQGNYNGQQKSIENITIDLNVKDVSLSEIFRQITKSTKIRFSYRNADLEHVPHVSIKVEKEKLQQVLNQLTNTHGLEWKFLNDVVVIRKIEKQPPNDQNVMNLDTIVNITGVVRDPDNRPIPGVSISVKGTGKGVTTNDRGEFYFTSVPQRATLVFRSIGFLSQERKIGNETNLSIVMHMDIKEIEAVSVVSTGYQDIPKERATGSFFKVDQQLLNRSVSSNIMDRLIGVTSSFNYEPTGPNHSNRSNISIRGISTISANQKPLLVVDGFPYDESGDNQNVINSINPNDIESITILKDAAAASIWGARAGNGVIVIKTKNGKYGQQAVVKFISNVTIEDKPNLGYLPLLRSDAIIGMERMVFSSGYYDANLSNTDQYPVLSPVVEILNKLRNNDLTESEANSRIGELKEKDIKSDLNRYLLQNSVSQQYALNISGGGINNKYYASVGYDKSQGNRVREIDDRITLRLENTFRLLKNIEVNGYIGYTKNKQQNNSLNFMEYLTSNPPYLSLGSYDAPAVIPYRYRETYLDTLSFQGLLDWRYRPLDELSANDFTSTQSDTRFGAGLKYEVFPGLTAEIKYQYQRINSDSKSDYNSSTFFLRDLVNQYSYSDATGRTIYPIPNGGILGLSNSALTQWNFRSQISYNHVWNRHTVSSIAGIDSRENSTNGSSYRSYGFDPLTGTINNNINYETSYTIRPYGFATIPNVNGILGYKNRFLSYFGNASYSFDNKYTLSASARLDGSNFFGIKANQRITPLWSTGLAWNVSKEGFYNIEWLPLLKIRTTYGYNGNTSNTTAAYPTIRYTIASSSQVNPGLPYAAFLSPGNPGLKWEKIEMINIGLDWASRNNRIQGSIEYYKKRGVDLIGPVNVDATTGWSSYVGNRASIKGSGIDIIMETKNITTDIGWNTVFLLSHVTDMVAKYEDAASSAVTYVQGYVVEGKPLYSLFSYPWAGLNPTNGDPRGIINDTATDYANFIGTAKVEDVLYNGRSTPAFFGSVRNNLTYKGFSFSFNVVFKMGYYFRRNSINYFSLYNYQSGHNDYLKRWKKSGDEAITSIPSMPVSINSARQNFYDNSSILVEKGDHIRLQDIRLSYDLDSKILERMHMGNIQLYLYARNLGVIWSANRRGIDPDYGDTVIPPSKSLAVGINVGF